MEEENIPLEDCITCLQEGLETFKEVAELDVDACIVPDQDDSLTLMITANNKVICEIIAALIFAYDAWLQEQEDEEREEGETDSD